MLDSLSRTDIEAIGFTYKIVHSEGQDFIHTISYKDIFTVLTRRSIGLGNQLVLLKGLADVAGISRRGVVDNFAKTIIEREFKSMDDLSTTIDEFAAFEKALDKLEVVANLCSTRILERSLYNSNTPYHHQLALKRVIDAVYGKEYAFDRILTITVMESGGVRMAVDIRAIKDHIMPLVTFVYNFVTNELVAIS